MFFHKSHPLRVRLEIGANLVAHIASAGHAVRTGDDEIHLTGPAWRWSPGTPKNPRDPITLGSGPNFMAVFLMGMMLTNHLLNGSKWELGNLFFIPKPDLRRCFFWGFPY